MTKKRIGELLVERGAITAAQLESGLAAQKRTRQRLGAALIQQGAITEPQLATVLGESLGIEVVDLTKVSVDWSAIHMLRARFCENHELFPYGVEGKGTPQKKLIVAMSDPLNDAALDEIGFTTGLAVSIRVGTHTQIRDAILRYYHKVSSQESSGATRAPTFRLQPAEEEPAVIMGEEVAATMQMPAVDTQLEAMISAKMQQAGGKKKTGGPNSKDQFDALFASGEHGDPYEQLERRFWTLLKIMARKGLITREEFSKELDGEK